MIVHCVGGGSLPPRESTRVFEGARDVLGRPAHLQVDCHRAAVDEFGQASDAQWESQTG